MQTQIVIHITPEELEALIDKSVARALEDRLPKDNDLLLPAEVAAYFRVTVQTILSWRKQGKLIGVVMGEEIRFKRSELEEAPNRKKWKRLAK